MISLVQQHTTLPTNGSATWVKDVNTTTFLKEVLEASMKQPVLVDFWAPWCRPCQQLSPILEKLAQEGKGRWILAKINADENKTIAAQLKVQSLPTVYLFQGGQPIDGFVGVLSETQIRQFLAIHLPNEHQPNTDTSLESAEKHWRNNEISQALSLLQMHPQTQEDSKAITLFIRCLYATGQAIQAHEIYKNLPEEKKDSALKTLFNLIEQGQQEQIVETMPYQSSLQLFAKGQYDDAMKAMLNFLTVHKDSQQGRETLLQMFEAIGVDHPQVHHYRRQLSTQLFI